MSNRRDDIEKYKRGELTSAEMHALEKQALRDPFLADALEGADSISPEEFSKDLIDIDQRFLSRKKKTIWFTPLRIAAGIVLLIGSVFGIYTVRQPEEQLALQKEVAPAASQDTVAIKNETELLSMNQPKEETESESEIKTDRRSERGPSPAKEGSGEAKPIAGISTTAKAEPVVADDASKTDQIIAPELSEVTTEEKAFEKEEIVAAAPAQQELKKEVARKDLDSRAKGLRSAVADDTQRKIISGQVVSSEDGLPLPGVNVTVKGTTIGTVTNMLGNYSIPVENEGQALVFSFIGLQTNEVSPGDQTTLNIKLVEDVSQLSEVVVTGQGLKTDRDENDSPVIKLAEPFGGKKAYDKYLESNLRYPQQALDNNIKGRVTIQFDVDTDGTLSNFSVMRSLGHGCDDEVIRLVKEGPKWSPSTEDNVAIQSNVRVRMKFDPAKVKK